MDGVMHCYECSLVNENRDSVGLCHHRSAALCEKHLYEVDDPVTEVYPLMRRVVLPKKARLLLCGRCKAALAQRQSRHEDWAAGVER